MTGDPLNTFVVRIADLDKRPLVDTRGKEIVGVVADVRQGNQVAIVTISPLRQGVVMTPTPCRSDDAATAPTSEEGE